MKAKGRYFHTKDNGVHFVIFKALPYLEYEIYSATGKDGKLDLAAGRGKFEKEFSKLRDAINWVKIEIRLLEI